MNGLSQTQDFGITLTDNAAKRIANKYSGINKSLRIKICGGGCKGFQYKYELVDSVNPDDMIISAQNSSVIIDKNSCALMSGAVIDYVEELGSSSFVIKNPNSTAKCGCGNSFGA